MKKIILLIVLWYAVFAATYAKGQGWGWVYTIDTIPHSCEGYRNTVDKFGNVYGFATGTADAAGLIQEKILVKHNAATGNVVWILRGLGDFFDESVLTTDQSGNIYFYYDTAGSGYTAYKLAKIDSSGNIVWIKSGLFEPSTYPDGFIMSYDNIGHIYVSGRFGSSMLVTGIDTLLNSTGTNYNSYIVKYDTAGNVLWSKIIKADTSCWSLALANDKAGDLFIGGHFDTDTTLTILDTTISVNFSGKGIFLAKLDTSGHIAWIRINRSKYGAAATFLGVDGTSNVYMCGDYGGSAASPDTLDTIPLLVTDSTNIFVAKYRYSDGQALWATTGGGIASNLLGFGTSLAGGSFVLFGNAATSQTNFGGYYFTCPGVINDPLTIVGTDSSGQVICGSFLGERFADDQTGIFVDTSGLAYITGDLLCSTCVIGDTTIHPASIEAYFTAKYSCSCCLPVVIGAISGDSILCKGDSVSLNDSVAGGTWSSSNTTVATVGLSTGIAVGLGTGFATITYTEGGGFVTKNVIVILPPGPIVGPSDFCADSSINLHDSTPGGYWVSSNTVVATIDSVSGLLTGLSGGATTISYLLSPGCYVILLDTVKDCGVGVTTISGDSILCKGDSLLLSDATTGGTWSSSNVSVATVGSGSGMVTGLSSGTAVITYSVGGGYVTKTMMVNPSPAVITGGGVFGDFLCVFSLPTTLSDTVSGGIWSSSNNSVASVGSTTGIVTYVGSSWGLDTIFYTISSGCYTSILIGGCEGVATPRGNSDRITLFPNPAKDELTITSSGKISGIKLTNLLGQIVYSWQLASGSQQVQVDVSAFPAGVYFVKINGPSAGSGQVIVRKFVKE